MDKEPYICVNAELYELAKSVGWEKSFVKTDYIGADSITLKDEDFYRFAEACFPDYKEEIQKEVCPMCQCEKVICTHCGEMYCKKHDLHSCEL